MTRRHYVLLAEALRSVKPADFSILRHQWFRDCEAIVDTLARDNPHGFDRALFLTNCGINKQE